MVLCLKKIFLFCCVVIVVFSQNTAIAQDVFNSNNLFSNYFGLEVSNRTPSLEEIVDIRIASESESTSDISSTKWLIGGVRNIAADDSLSIDIPITNTDGPIEIVCEIAFFNYVGKIERATVRTTVYPIQFEIIWEGDVVTPTQYLGYPRPSSRAPVRVSTNIIYHDGKSSYTEDDFSFVWRVNGERFDDVKKIQQSTITIPNKTQYTTPNLSVEVIATQLGNKSLVVRRKISIPRAPVRLLVYEFRPDRGVLYDKTVAKRTILPQTTATLVLHPLLFPKQAFNNNSIAYNWFINDEADSKQKERKVDVVLSGDGIFVFRVVAENREGEVVQQQAKYEFTIKL